jgi:cytochrome c oxidase cbb3-type subunit 2
MLKHHAKVEKNVLFLVLGIFLTVSIGGIVEILPLFTIESTIEKVKGVRPYSPLELAGRNMYDRPFQWGSKRTGPDLARVGGKYSNEWHTRHLINPRSVVPESVMPGYPHLAKTPLDGQDIAEHLKTLQFLGDPYTAEMVDNARADLANQATPDADVDGLLARYPKAAVGDFDGQPGRLTEMDAVIAYMQILGRMVDFTDFDPASADR